jgi:hypothetical protein
MVAYLILHLIKAYDSTRLASVDRLYQMLLHLRQFLHQFDEWKKFRVYGHGATYCGEEHFFL